MLQTLSPTGRLADFAAAARWDELPEAVRHEARRAFVNWVGCAFGGARHAAVDACLAALGSLSASARCTVLGRLERLDPLGATLLNGLSVGVNAFDDAHVVTVIHPAAPTVAALLAHAEETAVRGADFLLALVLSHEIQCRLSLALAAEPARSHVGHFMTGLVAPVGVALGLGRLMGLKAERLVDAMGIGAMQGGGFRASHGSMSSPFIPGEAGRAGLMAARLAASGFTCAREPLTSPNGMLAVVGNPAHPDALTDRLGERWDCLGVAIKPFPNGCVIHAATDACLQIALAGGFEADAIERVDLEVNAIAVALGSQREPRDIYEAWVSLSHWAAITLLRGRAGLAEAGEAAVGEDRVVALSRRVHFTAPGGLAPDEARAVVTLRDGRRLEGAACPHVGSAARPLSDAALAEKFLSQTREPLGREKAERLLALCWGIEDARDVGRSAPGFWGPETTA